MKHKERLQLTLMKEYKQKYAQEKSFSKKRSKFFVGGISFVGVGSAIAIGALIMTFSTAQPQVVTAEELLSDASNQLDILNQLKDNEVYFVSIKNVETRLGELQNEDGTKKIQEPIVTKEEKWTDGKLYRSDSYSPKGTLMNSALWVMDNETQGNEWDWQEEYEDEEMKQTEHVRKQPFKDYPSSGSILDTNAEILTLLPTNDSNKDTEQYLEQQWNTDFKITGEEDVDGVAAYKLTGYTLGRETMHPTMDAQQITDTLITREYWISKDGHRLVKEKTIVPNRAQYEKYYSVGEISNDTHKLNFEDWKKEFDIDTKDIQDVIEFPQIYLTPENQQKDIEKSIKEFEPIALEACQEITGKSEEECRKHDALKRDTLQTWEECAENENEIQTCNDQLAAALKNQETFSSFCELSVVECQQLYDDWKAQGFKNTP